MFDEYKRTWEDRDGDISPAQTEFATQLRVPFLTSSSPGWPYVIGVVVCDSWEGTGVVPTDGEVTAVAERLQEYNDRWYNTRFLTVMKEFALYDIDSSANLGYFIKRPDGGWAYRKRTWERGPQWVPQPTEPTETLQQVLDRTRGHVRSYAP